MEKQKLKRALKKTLLILLSSTIICNTYNKMKKNYSSPDINPEYNGTNYFATYSQGKVFICSKDNEESVSRLCSEKDLIVLDERDEEDPNMVVLKSYSVNDVFTMKEVLNIMLTYEHINPSNWDRTYESMRNEWMCHNLSYMCNYHTDRTADADFNNLDEDIYKDINVIRLIKFQEEHLDE